MAIQQEHAVPIDISDELRTSFMDYAMSVIISRALPDVRDGLKPVHRRILVTMRDLNLTATRAYRKCAKIAGDVSGNYHPHGESVVYPSLVRMAQDFSLRYPLIDGQGNFGSIDGDPPAAMRYTEARMTRIGEEMLRDITKNTVDYAPNYDGTRDEPIVLPSAIPNLLVNGSSGIAVGMATNIPPHNLAEVVDALVLQLERPECTLQELLQCLPGPDFPTGGTIHGRRGIWDAYRTGRGFLQLRARCTIEEAKRQDRESIVVTEIPYQLNKTKLLERIAEMVRAKKIEGVADLRDESDREGMRIVLDLKRDAMPQVVMNQLYANTQLQSTFGVIMLALVDNEPRVLPLKDLLIYFLEHRREVVIRRTRYDLERAQEREHILAGLMVALDHLDMASPAEARQELITRLALSEIQAQAILDLRLQRLTGLERDKILQEHTELLETIQEYQAILANEARIQAIIKDELLALKDQYGDARRTEIVEAEEEIDVEDLIAEEDMVVTKSHGGYIKRQPISLYQSQRRGGKGKLAMQTNEEDFVEQLFVASISVRSTG
jgi:DNA gyrase subunit A